MDDNPTTFFIKAGDLLPVLEELLRNDDDTPIVMPAGTTVRFHLKNRRGELLVDEAAVVVDGDAGHVTYVWQDGNTDVAGTFLREWEITFPSGKPLTVPNDQNGYRVLISEQLA